MVRPLGLPRQVDSSPTSSAVSDPLSLLGGGEGIRTGFGGVESGDKAVTGGRGERGQTQGPTSQAFTPGVGGPLGHVLSLSRVCGEELYKVSLTPTSGPSTTSRDRWDYHRTLPHRKVRLPRRRPKPPGDRRSILPTHSFAPGPTSPGSGPCLYVSDHNPPSRHTSPAPPVRNYLRADPETTPVAGGRTDRSPINRN